MKVLSFRETRGIDRFLFLTTILIVANFLFVAVFLVLWNKIDEWITGYPTTEAWGVQLGLVMFGWPYIVAALIQLSYLAVAFDRISPIWRRICLFNSMFVLIMTALFFWIFDR